MKLWAYMLVLTSMVCSLGSQGVPATDEIRIGTTASLTGRFAELGRQQFHGTTMWADDVNARGALLGRRVRLIHYDDGSDAEKSARLYQRLGYRRIAYVPGYYSGREAAYRMASDLWAKTSVQV